MKGTILTSLALLNVIIIKQGFITSEKWYYLLLITLPLFLYLYASEKKAS